MTFKSTNLPRKIIGFLAVFIAVFVLSYNGQAQINITANQTASALAQKLVGTGVNVYNTTLNCPGNANGTFVVVTSNLGLDSGIILSTGQAATVGTTYGANTAAPNFASTSNSAPGDPDLTSIAGQTTNDRCVLEFDFVPAGDTIKFDYIFASEEYNGPHGNFNCSINDVFAFFISGPGITGTQNIALVPGTTVPVGVSTVNDGVGASPGNSCYTNTAGNGPYTQYYNQNTSSTSLVYSGFTDVFTALKAVIPCNTYHLKLAIADASDFVWDSGVFLKAGSLTSNAVTVTPVGGGGLSAPVPYCVRGCVPGQFIFSRPIANATPLTIHYQIQGTAVNGTDYTFIPDSIVIPAGQTTATRSIFGLPANPPTGPVTVKLLIFSPYACSTPVIIDSAELAIYDSIYVNILTPDTAVCKYQSVDIDAEGDSLLAYSWTPATWIDSPNVQDPTVTPLETTTYTISATIPGSGCPPAHDHVTITIKTEPEVDAGPDITTCLGVPIQFNTIVTPTTQNYTFTWSPPTYLSSTTIADPVSNPLNDITYYVKVDPGAVGCFGYDTVNVHILPNDFTLFNHDTAICHGASVLVNAIGDVNFTYTWNPGRWVSDSTIINPVITPDTSQQYTLTASFPSCPDIVKSLFIDVQPNPQVFVGADREKCQWDTLQINPVIVPSGYPNYTYSWTPAGGIDFPSQRNIVFSGQQDVKPLTLTLTTPAGCTGSDDLDITVHQGNFATLVPADTGICPRDSVHLRVSGGVIFDWSPGYYLTDSAMQSPVAFPVTSTGYTLLATDQFGCFDTLVTYITVHPDAVLELGDNVVLYPGESFQMDPQGNALYFSWFPPLGLSATDVANPVAMPDVNTRYFVNAATEYGCLAMDSIDVIVNNESLLDLPNAFSPGSYPNNEIKIVRRGLATLKYFRIFNRWGAKVFETSNIDEGWDGELNGKPQPMGVYVYVIEAETNTGRPFVKQGNITLIR